MGKSFKSLQLLSLFLKDDNAVLYNSESIFLALGFHQGLPLLCVAGCWGWEVGFGELTLLARKAAAAWSGTGKAESLFGLKSKTSHELVSSQQGQSLTLYEESQR